MLLLTNNSAELLLTSGCLVLIVRDMMIWMNMTAEGGETMTMLKGVVSKGRIELDEPLNLPDGTVLMIPLPNGKLEGGTMTNP